MKQIEIVWHSCDYCGGYGVERKTSFLTIPGENYDFSIEMHELGIDIKICFLCLEKVFTHTLGESQCL